MALSPALSAAEPKQDTDFIAITYNIATGAHHVLNVQNPTNVTLDGVKITPTGTIPTLLHNASIAPGGNYVCLDGVGGQGIAIWNVNAGTVYQVTASPGGHKVFGYGPDENAGFVNEGTNLTQTNATWLIRKVDSSTDVNIFNDLVEHPSTDPQRWDSATLGYDSHMSWNNARSNASYPVFVDSYHGRQHHRRPALLLG